MTEAEEAVLEYRKTRNPELLKEALLQIKPFIAYRAMKFYQYEIEDLIQEGMIVTMRAIELWDENRQKFHSYLASALTRRWARLASDGWAPLRCTAKEVNNSNFKAVRVDSLDTHFEEGTYHDVVKGQSQNPMHVVESMEKIEHVMQGFNSLTRVQKEMFSSLVTKGVRPAVWAANRGSTMQYGSRVFNLALKTIKKALK